MRQGWTTFGPWTSTTNGSVLDYVGMAVWTVSLERSFGWWSGGTTRIRSLYVHNISRQSELLVVRFCLFYPSLWRIWWIIRCTMRHPKWPWHREFPCGICTHTHSSCTQSLSFRLYSAQLEAWSLEHQTGTNVVTIPSDMDQWIGRTPGKRGPATMV